MVVEVAALVEHSLAEVVRVLLGKLGVLLVKVEKLVVVVHVEVVEEMVALVVVEDVELELLDKVEVLLVVVE